MNRRDAIITGAKTLGGIILSGSFSGCLSLVPKEDRFNIGSQVVDQKALALAQNEKSLYPQKQLADLSPADSRRKELEYHGAPKVNLHVISSDCENIEQVHLNTNIIAYAVPALAHLEDKLSIGPGKRISSDLGSKMSIDAEAFTPGNSNFLLRVGKTRQVKDWKDNNNYKVEIIFGNPALEMVKRSKDHVQIYHSLTGSAIGFAVAGPWGAGGQFVEDELVNQGWIYFMQPSANHSARSIVNSLGSTNQKVDRVHGTLQHASEIGSKYLVVVPYKDSDGNQGSGMLYLPFMPEKVGYQNNILSLEANKAEMNIWKSLILESAQAATRWHLHKKIKEIIRIPGSGNRSGVSGGQTGSPGGRTP